MLSRLQKWQLSTFAVITVITVSIIAVNYVQIPAALGFGSYTVTANFAASGGLYKNANVAYRGTTVGRVTDVSLAYRNGVNAQLRIGSGAHIPANVTATVKSVSAIGEQYVDLVPPDQPSPAWLRDGSRINRDHTVLNGDVAGLLHEAQRLVDSISQSRLRDLLHDMFKAFDGSGPELARLIQSARLLADAANAHGDDIAGLIDQVGPFLDTQIRSGDAIRRLADGAARFTGHVRGAAPQISNLLQIVPEVAPQVGDTMRDIRPDFPMLAANLANFGRIGVIYRKSLEQVLVIFPAMTAVLLTIAQQVPFDEGARADFKLALQDPPPCSVGFIPAPLIRSPADETVRDIPGDMYCKVPQSDPVVVRGARNYPCQEFPGKRAPTIQLCRDPKGYVPIGRNAWRGPPVPLDTPVPNPRNTLPPNKFPLIPPGADYDPGPPVVQLPPGVPTGPGPAPIAPFPLQVPPVGGPPPPPLPFGPPPDRVVPPYGQRPDPVPTNVPGPPPSPAPQAQGPMGVTYDPSSGKFLDPSGEVGIFAAGASKLRPAETWLDMMMCPTQE
ncbi:MCE family protein [Mycobacterium intracellulare]|uniref:MCE family protein n=1 Tax=Mycobacterium intracellulare TaxID=1767 RepID=UPI001EEE2207|nr:MCE family protein [Mycobacterium intracellulare]MEE3749803.1 MCE family protein [Mycobacterium intracellulare]